MERRPDPMLWPGKEFASMSLAYLPPMAQGSWYVLKSAAPSQAAPEDQPCYVADRIEAGTGEQQVAGPFPTHEAGEKAMLELAACQQGIEFQEGD